MAAEVLLHLMKAVRELVKSDQTPASKALRKALQRRLERTNPIKYEIQDFQIFTPGGN